MNTDYLKGVRDAIKVLRQTQELNTVRGNRSLAAEFNRAAEILESWITRRLKEVVGSKLEIHDQRQHGPKGNLRSIKKGEGKE